MNSREVDGVREAVTREASFDAGAGSGWQKKGALKGAVESRA